MSESVVDYPFTNRLVDETSPYLLQHAHNPVDWFPWGPDAFERARSENKPIFLSVGYSACHWCHVMEHESFEDEETAALMNEHYVNIKVDREERPDVDEIYMNAVQMMTQQGGWPMSVFLTPEGKPFYGGTYFPPDSQYGRPGFRQVLVSIADFYRTRRDEVDRAIDGLMEGLDRIASLPGDGDALDADLIPQAASLLARSFDERDGGFGSQPKFPNSMSLEVFLRNYGRTGQAEDLSRVTMTLDRMARGGIYDQLGGGFHRYSVDHKWLVPHFEKMLYDNALLAKLYLQTSQVTGSSFYQRVGSEILEFVIREMTADEGGFCSTLDADTEGEEGKFYVWTPDEIRRALGTDAAEIFCDLYDVHDIGNFEGHSILNLPVELELFAQGADLSDEELEGLVDDAKIKLLQVRSERPRPGRDDKVQVSWNGLMISAFAIGYQVTGDARYLDAGTRAATFILGHMVQDDGRLLHSYKDGKAQHNAYLDDYSGLINALIDLYESTFDVTWLEGAQQLADTMVEQFWDDAGDAFYYTGVDHETLIVRSKNPYDNATPSGNSLACVGLLRLGTIYRRADYSDKAERTLRRFQPYMKDTPNGFAQMVCAADYALSGAAEVTITEGLGRGDLTREIHSYWVPTRVMAISASDQDIAMAEGMRSDGGDSVVYVCRDQTCSPPVRERDQLDTVLGAVIGSVP
jgi:uncharacterized protein